MTSPSRHTGSGGVPLRSDLAAALRRWKLASAFSADDDLVFAGPRGRPYDNAALRHALLDPAAKAARLTPFGWHTLRHTCASHLLVAGVPPLVVSRMIGHHSAAFTLDVYGHVLPSDVIDLDALDRAAGR